MTATAVDLRTLDHAHLLHPQHHPADHADPLIFDRGEGALLWTVDEQRFIDAYRACGTSTSDTAGASWPTRPSGR